MKYSVKFSQLPGINGLIWDLEDQGIYIDDRGIVNKNVGLTHSHVGIVDCLYWLETENYVCVSLLLGIGEAAILWIDFQYHLDNRGNYEPVEAGNKEKLPYEFTAVGWSSKYWLKVRDCFSQCVNGNYPNSQETGYLFSKCHHIRDSFILNPPQWISGIPALVEYLIYKLEDEEEDHE